MFPFLREERRGRFFRVFLAVFFFLIVTFTVLGFSPDSVRELNNYFFSLFISEETISPEIEGELGLLPQPSVFVTKTDYSSGYKPASVSSDYKVSNGGTAYFNQPTRLRIPKISTDVAVLNPTSEDARVLDAALLKGVVRYPTSGDFSNNQTIFLFGHSSYLPVVHNKNFKAFNEIQKLVAGDEIFLSSSGVENKYKVIEVDKTKAEDAVIVIKNDRSLVLSTCNSFASKDDRFVVYADFVESAPR